MMRVMLDGEYFAEWDGTLEEFKSMNHQMGETSITLDRLSWDVDQRYVKARTEALRANNEAYNLATLSITKDYPQLEKDTWPTQDKEIKAYKADNTASTPWIDTAAAVRGLTRADYIARTVSKIAMFEQASAYLTGLRQKYEDRIKASTDADEIEAIQFVYNIPGG